MKNKNTLVINLLSGPGAGKSTMAAEIFAKLKWSGVDCELVTEYVKDLVWEKRHKTIENQLYIFGKQHNRIFRLLGQVQAIVTDSPLFLTPIYDAEKRETLKKLVFEETSKCNNLNFFVVREKVYNPNGRHQTRSKAKILDKNVEDFLIENEIPFHRIAGNPEGVKLAIMLTLDTIKNT